MMKNSFLRGTVILFCTSVLLRGLGFLYQIIIVRLIGTESMGIFNMTSPFYMILLVLISAGLPVAIAKMTAEYISTGQQDKLTVLLRTAFSLVGVLMVLAVFFAIYGMPWLFDLLQTEERVQQCFWIFIPGMVIVPIASIMRGYFQGKQQMLYPSIGQVAEQLVRVGAGIALVLWLKPFGVFYLALGLTAAAMLGEVAGLMVIAVLYFYHRRRDGQQTLIGKRGISFPVMGEMLSFGLPVTFTRVTSSIDMAIEASIIPLCLLAIGYNYSQAASIYGQFSSVAISLLMIPTMLTGALATALVPAIAEAAVSRQQQVLEQRCSLSLRLTYSLSLPVIITLYCYGGQLSQLLFQLEDIGAMIPILALGAISIYLGQTLVGILQGLGKTREVFINNFFGSAAKLIAMYYCIKLSRWGVDGIAVGMVIGYGLQCLLNLLALSRVVQLQIKLQDIAYPMLNGILFYGQTLFWQAWLPGSDGAVLLLSIVLGGLAYLVILQLTGQIQWQQLKQ